MSTYEHPHPKTLARPKVKNKKLEAEEL
uniref:Uncharacterized protein n=1 Tax=Arundo donax TaxID=35708 RepID=A0A0A9FPD6_ARUDO